MTTASTTPLPPSLVRGDVAVGDELPEQRVDVSATTIISTAIASRDYQDVHHDRDLARTRGNEDIFMNILSTNGFVLRLVTDWAGPEAIVEKCAIQLGVPNYAGDEMVLGGEVVDIRDRDDDALVSIDVVGRNSRGDHVTGTVHVSIPHEVEQ